MYTALFSPGKIGHLEVRNRIVMAPMAVNLGGLNGEITEQMIQYYEARARGGAGTVFVEAACVDTVNGNRGPGQVSIDHAKYLTGLFNLVDRIKIHGARAFIQLFHPGRQTNLFLAGGEAVAPSAIPCPMMKVTPRALEIKEIQELVQKYILSACIAAQAGFDGVEIHAAHGYLINQFLSPHSNQRNDQYGGSLENRMRFLLEIIQGIHKKLPRILISVRLNMDDFVPGGLSLNESVEISKHLESAGIHILHCSCGTYESGLTSIEPACYEEGWRVYMAQAVKEAVSIPVISGGMMIHPAAADEVIASGKADFVFIGRNLIADPDWPNKVRKGDLQEVRPCIRCNTCIGMNFKGVQLRCAVNPYAGQEIFQHPSSSVIKDEQAIVVGGGPAGLHAAISLRKNGYKVSLYEEQDQLGGFMNVAGVPSDKTRILGWRDYLVRQVYEAGVDVCLNCTFHPEDIQINAADVLVIAVGSQPFRAPIKGSERELCVEGIDVLSGAIELSGQQIVIIGGGSTGCEEADYLMLYDKNITIVEKANHLAADMERKNRRALINRLDAAGVTKMVGARVLEILPDSVRVAFPDGQEEFIKADHVVWATGFEPKNEILDQLHNFSGQLFVIGDASEVRGFREAVAQGESVGYTASSRLK
ncbi:MAG: NAD(P)/FAD-dependent oxidoreductase [Bacillota bacterium]|nr:NAD(P)/FAD-dependent oxidoreductase [Bacillota bacterium]